MQALPLSHLVVLAAVVCAAGADIECYYGQQGTGDASQNVSLLAAKEDNCTGSCTRTTKEGDTAALVILGCSEERKANCSCIAEAEWKTCFCNDDSCNYDGAYCNSSPSFFPSFFLLPLLFFMLQVF